MKTAGLKKAAAIGGLLAAMVLSGCGGTSDSTVQAFIDADADDLTYAYVMKSGVKSTVSDFIAVSDTADEERSAVTETISDLQEALPDAELTETEDEFKQTDLLYIFKMPDNSILYLYNDGSIKTVDAEMNRTMYHGDDDLKEVAEDAEENLDEWLAGQE
jgi:hypothetical protein